MTPRQEALDYGERVVASVSTQPPSTAIASKGEQYAGYRAIASAPAPLTTEQAIGVLAAVLCSGGTDVRDDLPKAIRRAKALAHPDRNNGARGQWDQVEEAARVLEAVIAP